jgi:hypothetical protein
MASLGHYRIVAIARTLPRDAGVNVNVRHDLELLRSTFLPNHAKPCAIELDDPVLEALRVNVVVEEKLFNPARLPPFPA